MVAAFALQRLAQDPTLAKSVRVYYSDDATDTYSANLRQDVMHAFASQGFHTSAIAFTPSAALGPISHHQPGDTLIGNAVAAGRDTCGYHGFVFFAGRGVPDYGDFLSGAEQCTNTAVFIGGDDVSRYVANSTLRGQCSVPYYYVSFAPAPIASPPGAEHDFYTNLRSLFRFEQQPSQDRSLDGHAALSYDAVLVVITATEYLREGPTVLPVSPGNVWREITAIHSTQTSQPGADKAIDGATGTIDYGGDITQHVPLNKQIAILRVLNGQVDPNVQGLCGTVAGRVPSTWCPPDN
jgi:ABC-type branched-subunit amino acid transport system substrate-binding protein